MTSIWPQRRNPLEDRVLRRRRTPASALPGLGECSLLINDNDQSKLLTDDVSSSNVLRLDGGAFAAIPPPPVSSPATAYIQDEISAGANPGTGSGTRLDITWSQDGLKVWDIIINGSPSHSQRQYSVSPAWGIDSGDWTLNFTSGIGNSNNRSIWWSPDGTFFSRCIRVVSGNQVNITVFDQSATPFDFSVLGAATSKTFQPTGGTTPLDHVWSDDGLRLWLNSGIGGRIDEHTVGTPFDASTIVAAQVRSFAIGSIDCFGFSADGKQLYFVSSQTLRSRPMSTAFDIDTLGAQVIGPLITAGNVGIPRGLT